MMLELVHVESASTIWLGGQAQSTRPFQGQERIGVVKQTTTRTVLKKSWQSNTMENQTEWSAK